MPRTLARARDTLVSNAQKGVLLAEKYAPSYVTGTPEVKSGHFKQTTESYKKLLMAQKNASQEADAQQKEQDSATTNKGPR